MSGGRKKLPPLPMPELITVAEKVRRLKAAGEWPPEPSDWTPPRPAQPRRRGPCGTLLFAASMGMLDPPWLEEMEARLRATKPERDKARAERARERHHLARWPKGRDG